MSAKNVRIVFSKPDESSGFFSNYFSMLTTIHVCVNNGLLPYVDCSNTWFNPTCDFDKNTVLDKSINPWNWWFIQEESEENRKYPETGITRGNLSHTPKEFIVNPILPELRAVAHTYCKIKSHILEEEEVLYKHYIEGKTTLGILARGTEMLFSHQEHSKVAIETWPSVIKYLLEQNPSIENIFLVSDDIKIIEKILEAYPQVKYIKHFFRSTDKTEHKLRPVFVPWWLYPLDGDILEHRKRIGEECLIQTRLLSKCDYFVGSYSGMTNAVNFFRETPFKNNYII